MNTADPVHLVWFKRDLRTVDHAALAAACRAGPVLPLYIAEPSLWQADDASAWQWGFVEESLTALGKALAELGLPLLRLRGEVVDVLEALRQALPLAAIHSHQETGNALSYARDRAVAQWSRAHDIAWHEYPQMAVFRGGKRGHWPSRREAFVSAPPATLPERIIAADIPPLAHAPARWRLFDPGPCRRQRGGRGLGLALLSGFLDERAARYRHGLSSPLTAVDACSRLSPHLAWGTLSLREVTQATRARLARLDAFDPHAQRLAHGLHAFESRLAWHCHFIQKLEQRPELEHHAPLAAVDALRADPNPQWLAAWRDGHTGYPLVDACMAMLRATGWLNFRMRAMLMSFASYNLWLPWQLTGQHLARLFVDYEPGIHWPQAQMQSGSTGRNALRIYDPVKQALELDPHGKFVARWLPVLGKVPLAWRFEPWKMPLDVQMHCGVRIGHDYPAPCVPWEPTQRAAREQLRACQPPREARIITPAAPARRSRPQPAAPQQLALGF